MFAIFFPKAKPSSLKCWTPFSRSWQPVNCCTSSPWSRHRAHGPCPTPWWSPAEPSQPQDSWKEEGRTFVQLSHAWIGQEWGPRQEHQHWAEHSPAFLDCKPQPSVPLGQDLHQTVPTPLTWPTCIHSLAKLGLDWNQTRLCPPHSPEPHRFTALGTGAGHSLQPLWKPHSKAKAACVIPGFVVPYPTSDNDKHTQECLPAVQVLRALCFSLIHLI